MTWHKHSTWIFVAVVVLLPVSVFALVQLLVQNYQPPPLLGEKGHTVAPFRLTDQHGKTVTREDWKDKVVVANFFFTHCPSICPRMTLNLKRVQAYADIDELLITSFTVDPERDSVVQMARFAEKFGVGGAWQLLTGDKRDLYKIARKSLLITATDGDGGPEDFIHSENLVLIDKQLRIRGYYPGTNEDAINRLVVDIRKVANEK